MTRADGSARPPLPFDGDRAAVARELIRESDELPWLTDEEPEPDPTGPAYEVHLHMHHLCGHECFSGACESELNAICMDCELTLQVSLDRSSRRSFGMKQPESE